MDDNVAKSATSQEEIGDAEPAKGIAARVAWNLPETRGHHLELALEYARAGIKVFPCDCSEHPKRRGSPHKKPMCGAGGLYLATTDEAQIRKWWTKWPWALVGINLGAVNLVVVDADRHDIDKDGVIAFDRVIAEIGGLPEGVIAVTTGGAGLHYIFRQPGGVPLGNSPGRLKGLGIDVKGVGGYIIAPGSIWAHKRWSSPDDARRLMQALASNELPAMPDALADLIRARVARSEAAAAKEDDRPPRQYEPRSHSGSSGVELTPEETAEMVADALTFISAEDRSMWVMVGAILHDSGLPDARGMWDRWSATCPAKYSKDAQDRNWPTFGKGSRIATIGSIIKMARDAGFTKYRYEYSAELAELARLGAAIGDEIERAHEKKQAETMERSNSENFDPETGEYAGDVEDEEGMEGEDDVALEDDETGDGDETADNTVDLVAVRKAIAADIAKIVKIEDEIERGLRVNALAADVKRKYKCNLLETIKRQVKAARQKINRARAEAMRARRPPSEWKHLNDKNEPVPDVVNTMTALEKLGRSFRFNEFSHRVECDGADMTDNVLCLLRLEVENAFNFYPSKETAVDATLTAATLSKYHPVREYLDGLKWDGKHRIDSFFVTYFGAEDTPLNRAIARKTLLAGVRRIRQPGCKFDQITILETRDQGKGKSSGIAALVPVQTWFSDVSILETRDTKGVAETLDGVWIHESAELEGMNKHDVTRIKALASRTNDRCRAAYARYPEAYMRQCILFGTTNKSDYLRDSTGGRRFWPVKVGKVDVAGIARDRDQIWAEAAHYETLGESLILPEELWAAAAVEQEKRRLPDLWEDLLSDLEDIAEPVGGFYRVSTEKILQVRLEIPKKERGQAVAVRIAEIMQGLGWDGPKTVRFGHGRNSPRAKGYEKPVTVNEPPEEEEPCGPMGPPPWKR